MAELGILYHKMRHITLLGGVVLNVIIQLLGVIKRLLLSGTKNTLRNTKSAEISDGVAETQTGGI